MAKTKIIATLGPSSSNMTELRKMMIHGLDVVRLNFSHGDWKGHLNSVEVVRKLNKKYRRAIKIMQDLEGFRIRVGRLKVPVQLKKRQVLLLTQEDIPGGLKEVHFDYKGALSKFKKGTNIFIDDGRIILRVKSVGKKSIKTEVVIGGILKERKGINVPSINLNFDSLTEKDSHDVKFGIKYKVDYVAQSFVRNAKDIKALKDVISLGNPKCKLFAKVESQQALKNLDEIIDTADGIIVARGDLGICVPIYQVPVIQKEIIRKCLKARKPVVVATQMLDSMVSEIIPTRAEVTDVANAIYDGADTLLLSAETAVGNHPAKVIDMMNKIINYTEKNMIKR